MTPFNEDSVRGFLHEPKKLSNRGIVLTHGAGGNAKMPLLLILAEAFSAAGYYVLRCDMAFRQRKAFGPPSPSGAANDRASLCEAVQAMRRITQGSVILGGQSYGGRQSTILASEQPGLVEALLLLSYPLHPPGKAQQLRTEHFDKLRAPALFAHGTRDPFGSPEEMRAAIAAIPARTELLIVEGAAHGLPPGSAKKVLEQWTRFIA